KKSANRDPLVRLARTIAKSKLDDVRVDRKEWDFSTCPEDQLEACFFYELARECPHAVRAARALRKQRGQRADIPLQVHKKNRPLTDLPGTSKNPTLSDLHERHRVLISRSFAPILRADLCSQTF